MNLSFEQLILKRDNRCIECGTKLNGLSYSTEFERTSDHNKPNNIIICTNCNTKQQ